MRLLRQGKFVSAIELVREALLQATDGGKPAKLIELASAWSIPPQSMRRYAKGRPINATDYLKICGAIGHDPVTGGSGSLQQRIGDIDWRFIALALHGQRMLRGQTVRSACKAIGGISSATICRLEAGRECTIEHFLAICRYVGKHPYDVIPPVSHVKPAVKHVDRVGEKVTA